MNAKEIGERLKTLRGKRTRRTVCNETGISYSAMSNYECGLRVPTDQHKLILARYYGMSVDKLFFTDDNHNE